MAKACKGNTMSYRQSMGMGIAAQVEVDKTAVNIAPPPSGAVDMKRQDDVVVLQAMLQERGFDPGPIDRVWGNRTRSALFSALGEVPFTVSVDKHQVWLLSSDWGRLQRLPLRGAGPGPVTDEADGSASIVADEPNYLPWVLGAGGLLAVGGWYMWRGKKMKRNRRRRRRSSRR